MKQRYPKFKTNNETNVVPVKRHKKLWRHKNCGASQTRVTPIPHLKTENNTWVSESQADAYPRDFPPGIESAGFVVSPDSVLYARFPSPASVFSSGDGIGYVDYFDEVNYCVVSLSFLFHSFRP